MTKRETRESELRWNDKSVEPYRVLHSRIFSGRDSSELRCILFTSSQPSEGCSTVAWNMAIFLSKVQEEHVRFLELNLTRPARRPIVPAAREPGVIHVLRGEASLESAVQRVSENLHVLPTGCDKGGPRGRLPESGLSDLLQRAQEGYRYVVVDAPCVSGVPPMSFLAPRADGVVLVIRANDTRRHVASRSVQQLRQAGANMLGVVLNRRRYFIPTLLYRSL